jgi:hypothetical protein
MRDGMDHHLDVKVSPSPRPLSYHIIVYESKMLIYSIAKEIKVLKL